MPFNQDLARIRPCRPGVIASLASVQAGPWPRGKTTNLDPAPAERGTNGCPAEGPDGMEGRSAVALMTPEPSPTQHCGRAYDLMITARSVER